MPYHTKEQTGAKAMSGNGIPLFTDMQKARRFKRKVNATDLTRTKGSDGKTYIMPVFDTTQTGAIINVGGGGGGSPSDNQETDSPFRADEPFTLPEVLQFGKSNDNESTTDTETRDSSITRQRGDATTPVKTVTITGVREPGGDYTVPYNGDASKQNGIGPNDSATGTQLEGKILAGGTDVWGIQGEVNAQQATIPAGASLSVDGNVAISPQKQDTTQQQTTQQQTTQQNVTQPNDRKGERSPLVQTQQAQQQSPTLPLGLSTTQAAGAAVGVGAILALVIAP